MLQKKSTVILTTLAAVTSAACITPSLGNSSIKLYNPSSVTVSVEFTQSRGNITPPGSPCTGNTDSGTMTCTLPPGALVTMTVTHSCKKTVMLRNYDCMIGTMQIVMPKTGSQSQVINYASNGEYGPLDFWSDQNDSGPWCVRSGHSKKPPFHYVKATVTGGNPSLITFTDYAIKKGTKNPCSSN